MAIKTFNGTVAGSIKTINGVAAASIKTWNGISAGLVQEAAKFDGSNDALNRGANLTSIGDSKEGTFSVFYRDDGGDGTTRYFLHTRLNTRIRISHDTDNIFSIVGFNDDGGSNIVLHIKTSTAYTSDGTYRHILASWNLASAGTARLYVNDVSDLTETTYENEVVDYSTAADWWIGANVGPSSFINGAFAHLFFHTSYMDFSSTSNRRKFIDANGKPVDLGSDGSTPFGVQPAVYCRVVNGAAASTFANNLGYGGNFTITGSLDLTTGP